jgi:hypothetical protein
MLGLLIGTVMVATAALGAGPAVQRPIKDFLSTQGTFCFPTDHPSNKCLIFVPPDRNYGGWTNEGINNRVDFALIDYAGLAGEAYRQGKKPTTAGWITERALDDGRAEVAVSLYTENANAFAMNLNFNGDPLRQLTRKPTYFGHRPRDVETGAGQGLANTFLHLRFINTAPGADLPDLVQLLNFPEPGQKVNFVHFSGLAKGPLTAEFGVPEGTPGICTVLEIALGDTYTTEEVNCRVSKDKGSAANELAAPKSAGFAFRRIGRPGR